MADTLERIANRLLSISENRKRKSRRQLSCGCDPEVGMVVVRVRAPNYPDGMRDNRNPFLVGSERTVTSLLDWGLPCSLIETGSAQQSSTELVCVRHWAKRKKASP